MQTSKLPTSQPQMQLHSIETSPGNMCISSLAVLIGAGGVAVRQPRSCDSCQRLLQVQAPAPAQLLPFHSAPRLSSPSTCRGPGSPPGSVVIHVGARRA